MAMRYHFKGGPHDGQRYKDYSTVIGDTVVQGDSLYVAMEAPPAPESYDDGVLAYVGPAPLLHADLAVRGAGCIELESSSFLITTGEGGFCVEKSDGESFCGPGLFAVTIVPKSKLGGA